MNRTLIRLYGIVSYVIFLITFLYLIGFVGNIAAPKVHRLGQRGDLTLSLVVDVILLGMFTVQHSVMARPGFKRVWTQDLDRAGAWQARARVCCSRCQSAMMM